MSRAQCGNIAWFGFIDLCVAQAKVVRAEIYIAGDGTLKFRRTLSRLIEMQSTDRVANRPGQTKSH